jgi:hypothetical protein
VNKDCKEGISRTIRPILSATGSNRKAENLKKKADKKAAPNWILKKKHKNNTQNVCKLRKGENPSTKPNDKPIAISRVPVSEFRSFINAKICFNKRVTNSPLVLCDIIMK